MKKLVILSACLFAVSLTAQTKKITVAEYIKTDLKNMQEKAKSADKCVAARYTKMTGYVSTISVETVRASIEAFCTKHTGKLETFDYKGTTYTNALVLYTTPEVPECKDSKEPTGKRWFFAAEECATTDYTTKG